MGRPHSTNCSGCWVNQLDRPPCIIFAPILRKLPTEVKLRCYTVMTRSNWDHPGGRAYLFGYLNGLPATRYGATCSSPNTSRMREALSILTGDWAELEQIMRAALDIWPLRSPWRPFGPLGFELERNLTVYNAPFVADDGRVKKAHLRDVMNVKKWTIHRPMKLKSWDDWIEPKGKGRKRHGRADDNPAGRGPNHRR
jgi:hypothetical protein